MLDHFKAFIISNPIINSLMYIPVNCAIIAQVYKDISRSRKLMPKTMTQLYTTLVLVLIRRHMIERGEWDEHSRIPKNLKNLPKGILSGLKRVSELAYRGLMMEDVQLVFTDSDVGEGFQHLGLLSEAKEMYVCEGAKSSYSFPHLSIQEFLAAWHLACHPNLVTGALVVELGWRSLSAFLKFIAGLLGCSEFPIHDWMTDSGKNNLMVQCLYEAQESCKSLKDCVFPDMVAYCITYPLGYVCLWVCSGPCSYSVEPAYP